MQLPHLRQFLSTMENGATDGSMQDWGHEARQAPQPSHRSEMMYASASVWNPP